MPNDIAIAHKDYDTRGGGEVFCRRLAECLEAPLYVGRRNQDNEPDDANLDIREIPLSRVEEKMIDRGGVTRTAAYALRWQAAQDLTGYDTIITSGNEPLWYVPDDQQTVVAYTHSTPRYMYDLYNTNVDFSGVMGRVEALFNAAKRTVYESNVRRVDLWVANSDLVARRINGYWDIPKDKIRVVYPPVDTHRFNSDSEVTQDAYLHLGRLVEAKRVDELIEAFDYLDATLLIAGDGPDRDRLEKMAGDNVRFLGFVSEDEKRSLMERCKAMLYPALNEDFGMVPIESMAAGTPVIGVRDGFTQFQIMDGKNGLLYDRGFDNCHDAIRRFERKGVDWTSDEIAAWADRWFSVERFEHEMQQVIDEANQMTEVNTPWESDDIAAPTKDKEVTYVDSTADD